MAELFANDYLTTLAAPVGLSDTTISVASAFGAPLTGNFRVRVDNEIMLVTAVSGTTFTVSRAAEAVSGIQAATTHAVGATVEHDITAAVLGSFPVFLTGLAAAKPAAGVTGRFYWTTDTYTKWYDNGSVWVAEGFAPGDFVGRGAVARPGTALCDGSAVSRTASPYADLFAAISTNFGSGDHSTTFNLPDLRDRVPIGVSPGLGLLDPNRPTTRTIGQNGGPESVTLVGANIPAAFNIQMDSTTPSGPTSSGNPAQGNGDNAGNALTYTGFASSPTPVGIVQPYLVVYWLIKL